jgi:stage III sporulation protein AE
MGFFAVYIGILLLLLESFSMIGEVVEDGVSEIVSFMTAFVPTYAATLLLTGNATSAGVFYELAFALIYLLELGMKLLFVPGTHLFVLLLLLDNLFEETKLSKLAGLLEDGICLVLRLGISVIAGLGVVQSLIAPAKDRITVNGLYKGLAAMPGVGSTFSAVGELLVGSGIMIKNSVGVAALILLTVICVTPLLKVFCFHVMYRLAAALLEPFCDKRIAECVHVVGRGCAIYLRLLRAVLLLFWITVAMIGASTSFIY